MSLHSRRNSRHFTNTNIRVEKDVDLQPHVWYRSPLSDSDHLLGLAPEFVAELIAWCGWDLKTAHAWEDEEFGGLWYSERTSNRCAECARREQEYVEYKKTVL